MTKILEQLAKFIFKNKMIISILWLILILCSVDIIRNHNNRLEGKILGIENTDAYYVETLLRKDFNFNQEASFALLVDKKIKIDGLKTDIIKKFPQIIGINPIDDGRNHNYALYHARFTANYPPRDSQILITSIREVVREWEAKLKTKIYVTGDSAFFHDAAEGGKKDSRNNERIALIFSFFILIYTFGGLLTALLPLIIGGTTLIFLYGMLGLTNFENNTLSQSLNSLIGLGLAIDYSLFIISRFREEKENNDIDIALINTLKSAGKTIFVSSLIMIVSVSVLMIPSVSSSRTVVKSILSVITISAIVSLFFLPAFLAIGNKFLDKPLFLTNMIKKIDKYKFWRAFASKVVEYPKTNFSISLIILLLLASPLINIKVLEPMQTLAPKGSESRDAYEIIEKDGWGGELIPVIIVVKNNKDGNVYSQEFIKELYKFTKGLESLPEVGSVNSLTTWNKNFSAQEYNNFYSSIYPFTIFQNNNLSKLVNPKSDTTLIFINPKNLMNIPEITNIIDYSISYKMDNDYKIYTGGIVARAKDFTRELYRPLSTMLIVVIVGIFIILYLYMKTPILPIKASIMNFLPILSSFGILVLVFQYGYLSNILGTPNNGSVSNMIPVILFCVIFGLSMDYEVLILSRINEHYYLTGDVKESVIEGISRSSHIITGAALILLGVFVPGIFSSSPLVKEICLGISAAIFIDATLVRLILVPSFMMLLGKYNWIGVKRHK